MLFVEGEVLCQGPHQLKFAEGLGVAATTQQQARMVWSDWPHWSRGRDGIPNHRSALSFRPLDHFAMASWKLGKHDNASANAI
jgi:hypothetical protein